MLKRATTSRTIIDNERGYGPLGPLSLWLFLIALVVGLTTILAININRGGQFNLTAGERSSANIVAPRSITYDSDVLTAIAREEVTLDIFRYTPLDRRIGRQQTDQARAVFRYIEVVRRDSFADFDEKLTNIQAIEDLTIEDETAAALIEISDTSFSAIREETISLISTAMQQQILPDNLNQVRQNEAGRISFSLATELEPIVASLAPQFIVPNTFFDEVATADARALASESVQPVEQVISQDQLIIRVGEVVREDHLEALDKLGLLQQETANWYLIGRSFIISLLSALIISAYWWRFVSFDQYSPRYLVILLVLILLFAAVGRLLLIADLLYLFPASALAMLLTVIMRPRLAMIVVVVIAGLMGFMAAESVALEPIFYTATGSLITIILLRDKERFGSFFRAGAMGSIGNMAIIVLFSLAPTLSYPNLSVDLLMGLGNGIILSPIVTIAGFFLVGLFGIMTVVQLQDLSRLDHPLLRELLRQAPGTYHHSMMVANLAEQAAERVDANGTLVRVGAFYHDIGKMSRPEYFTENQTGINPHDSLDPYQSAEIILSHVTDGLELARRYRIPQRIQNFIAEHHGRGLLKVFYEKAKKQYLEEQGEMVNGTFTNGNGSDKEAPNLSEIDIPEVDINLFTYVGPRPNTRETGIVLLADTVEAASAAIRPSTESEIVKLVNRLVDDHLKAGQLDRSALTLGDIKEIKESFINTLKGRFHIRVRYPNDDKLIKNEIDEELEAVRQRRIPTIITRRRR